MSNRRTKIKSLKESQLSYLCPEDHTSNNCNQQIHNAVDEGRSRTNAADGEELSFIPNVSTETVQFTYQKGEFRNKVMVLRLLMYSVF